jgi:hypothetical protein
MLSKVNDIEVKEHYEVNILTCFEGVGDLKMNRASEGTGENTEGTGENPESS